MATARKPRPSTKKKTETPAESPFAMPDLEEVEHAEPPKAQIVDLYEALKQSLKSDLEEVTATPPRGASEAEGEASDPTTKREESVAERILILEQQIADSRKALEQLRREHPELDDVELPVEYKNEYLSYSRLSKFEQCPKSFRLHYIERLPSEPGLALFFGSALHKVIEDLTEEHVENEECAPFSIERAEELWQKAFAESGMVGANVYSEGANILRAFVREQGVVDSRDVLGVEKKFELEVGGFKVLGFIDRVMRVDDETIEIIDWKSNRLLFSREDVDTSLQMSIYQVACAKLYPWAKRIKLTFYMLRHGVKQETTRSQEQLDDALRYIETIARQTENGKSYPAKLNANCGYCDHRSQCSAYQRALKGEGRKYITTDLTDLEAVAREREEVAKVAKFAYSRKEELEKVLKRHLEEQDELILAGVKYRVFTNTSLSYPLEKTAEVLARLSKGSAAEEAMKISDVDKDALKKRLAELAGGNKAKLTMYQAEVEQHARKTATSRFWAKEL